MMPSPMIGFSSGPSQNPGGTSACVTIFRRQSPQQE